MRAVLSRMNLHPHLHFLVTEGGVDKAGLFHKVPRIDDSRLTELFARGVLAFLVRKELLSPEWAVRLLSWRHTGFNVHSRVRAKTKREAERAGKYMIRPLLSLERFSRDQLEGQVCYRYGIDPFAMSYHFSCSEGGEIAMMMPALPSPPEPNRRIHSPSYRQRLRRGHSSYRRRRERRPTQGCDRWQQKGSVRLPARSQEGIARRMGKGAAPQDGALNRAFRERKAGRHPLTASW